MPPSDYLNRTTAGGPSAHLHSLAPPARAGVHAGASVAPGCTRRGRGRPPHPPAPHLQCAAGAGVRFGAGVAPAGHIVPMSFGRASRPERGGGNLGRLNPGEGSQGIAWRFVHSSARRGRRNPVSGTLVMETWGPNPLHGVVVGMGRSRAGVA